MMNLANRRTFLRRGPRLESRAGGVLRCVRQGLRGAGVALQQATEPFSTLDLARERQRLGRIGTAADRHVADTLVRPIIQIVGDIFVAQVSEMPLADNYELVEQFDAQTLDKTLRVGIPLCDQLHRIQSLATELSG